MRTVFLGSEAMADGKLTRYELRRWHRPLFRDVYLPTTHEPRLLDRIEGAWLRSGRQGVVAGVAASWLHGAEWIDDDIGIELIWSNTRPPEGLIARDETLRDDEVTRAYCLPVTTPARTAYDLARHLPRDQAVARLDALGRATPFAADDVLKLAQRHHGARGSQQLRTALPLVDFGAASPKETSLRLSLVDAGLPRPVTQIPVCDRSYQPFAWLDMGWKKYRVAAEYDGDHHRKDRRTYVKDHRRQRRLERLGWINIRVINEGDPADVTTRVETALRSRGWKP